MGAGRQIMGVFEYRQYSYPVDDFTLTHLAVVLERALGKHPHVDVTVHFSARDRVRLRLTSESSYEIYVRNTPQVCEDCIADLLDELQVSDSLNLVCSPSGTMKALHP
jgi:hypothetical protein